MSSSEWIDGVGHVTVFGKSQTCKTTLARELHDKSPRTSIWLNHRGKFAVSKVAKRGEHPTGSPAGVAAIMSEASSPSEVKIDYRKADRSEGIQELQALAWSIADHYDRSYPIQIVIDEAHELLPEVGTREPGPAHRHVSLLLQQGMKRNIKLVLITQNPKQIDYDPLDACRWFVWTGPPSWATSGTIDYFQFPTDRLNALADREYLVMDDGNPPRVVSGPHRSNPRYA